MRLTLAGIVLVAMGMAGTAIAESGRDAPVTPATSIHGAPGNTPGFGGSSANPKGGGKNGGNGIHNIAGGAPGQNGGAGTGGKGGPSGNMHGGLDATTGRFNK